MDKKEKKNQKIIKKINNEKQKNIKKEEKEKNKKSPKERIGQNEFSQITTHPFFQSTNINAIVNQKLTPPLMPNISEDPYENFETIFTNQEIEDFEESSNPDVIEQIDGLFYDLKN